MNKPYYKLNKLRHISSPILPRDLDRFYINHEGIGIDSPPDISVRLCRLNEIKLVGWKGLNISRFNPIPPGWEGFSGILVGAGMFFEEIIYVLNAPICMAGSIMVVGGQTIGPGGFGPFILERTLIVASTFSHWIARLKKSQWIEPCISGLGDYSEKDQQQIIQFYIEMNPSMIVR